MKNLFIKALMGTSLVGAGLLPAGCVIRPERTVVVEEPAPTTEEEVAPADAPPPQTEVAGVAPAPGYVWIGGFWFWGGGRWAWRPGRWALPPRPGVVWYGPHYVRGPRGFVFVRGGWR